MAKDVRGKTMLPDDYSKPPFTDLPPVHSKDGLEMVLEAKFLCADDRVAGCFFTVNVDGKRAGRFMALLTDDLELVGDVGNVGIEVEPDFQGLELPTRTVELIAPTLRKHGVNQLMIVFDKETKSIRRACSNLRADFQDTISGDNGRLIDRHVMKI